MSVPTVTLCAALTKALPRQHGAWATLAAFYLLGVVAAWPPSGASLLVAALVLALFVAHGGITRVLSLRTNDPWRTPLVRTSLLLSALAVCLAAALWLTAPSTGLVALGMLGLALTSIAFALERRGLDRTFVGELVGIVGLSVTLPLVAYVGHGSFDVARAALWASAVMFFVGSILRVRYHVRARRAGPLTRGGRLRLMTPSLAFHLAALLVTAMAAEQDVLSFVMMVAWLPPLVGATYAVLVTRQPLGIRRVGLEEVILTVLFVAVSGIAVTRSS